MKNTLLLITLAITLSSNIATAKSGLEAIKELSDDNPSSKLFDNDGDITPEDLSSNGLDTSEDETVGTLTASPANTTSSITKICTIQQKSNGRYLDAHENNNDNSAVTRNAQNNDTQRWIVKKVKNNIFTIQQKSNSRYLDAYENQKDNSAVTRGWQNNDSQRWIIVPPPW